MNKPSQSLLGQCISEFLGTALIIFFGVGCVATLVLSGASLSQWDIGIIWGLGVAIAIYVSVGVSGAHLNPAVTLALMVFKNFDKKKVLPYIASQCLGAFTCALLIYFMYFQLFIEWELLNDVVRGSNESVATAGIFATFPLEPLTNLQALNVEIIITAILMLWVYWL
ncbi:MIP/aquaporin family protein [Colwellia maritima]|uniref:MIP/aquaporin family protein n=1 Tax=Colwellia maritima TaxID=2912588 RepID=UPI00237B458C|nr:MIP/aquaporin family protein [Colwellia maritima]